MGIFWAEVAVLVSRPSPWGMCSQGSFWSSLWVSGDILGENLSNGVNLSMSDTLMVLHSLAAF